MAKKISAIIKKLAKNYPAKGMVDLGTAEDTLIATALSARSRDEQVLPAYQKLRRHFPRLEDLARADSNDIAADIATIGLYRNKAKAVKGLAERLLTEYGGQVPDSLESLVALPGVGRKTANCVLWYGFGKPAMAVDTHVFRLAHRLGWARGRTPQQVEQELMALVPKKYWGEVNRTFVQFGRDVCRPGKPQCWRCPVRDDCPFKPKTSL